MEMTIRPMTPVEFNYCYTASQQIMRLTGCIGHMRGDMGRSGKEFWHDWTDHNADWNTMDFETDLTTVIDALREDPAYEGALKDFDSLTEYYFRHPEGQINQDPAYGYRIDTEQYSYMLRLMPQKGNQNYYCYAYRRDILERYMEQAAHGIRFVTSEYGEKFRLSNGDAIRITDRNGKTQDGRCRYIDDTHMELNLLLMPKVYELGEFAKEMERLGCVVIPLRSSLPDHCYNLIESTGEIAILKKGETGYYRTDISGSSKAEKQALVADYNEKLGVTPQQAMAMSVGSLCGWDAPGADPARYKENLVVEKVPNATRKKKKHTQER